LEARLARPEARQGLADPVFDEGITKEFASG